MGRQLVFPLRVESIWDWIDNIYKEETKKKKKKEGESHLLQDLQKEEKNRKVT